MNTFKRPRRLTLIIVAISIILAGCASSPLKSSDSAPTFVHSVDPTLTRAQPLACAPNIPEKRPIGGKLMTATPVIAMLPEYPGVAFRHALEGTVTFKFAIDKMGRACNVKLISSKPTGIFDDAALKALIQSRFQPITFNGQVVISPVSYTYRFELPPGFEPPIPPRSN